MRKPNWETRFAVAIDNGRTTRFVFGESDCCLWPCDCIRAVTGFDPGRRFRGQYGGPRGARAVIRRRAPSLETLVAQMAARFAVPELPSPTYAQRADIGIVRAGEDLKMLQAGFDCAVAVCAGPVWLIKDNMGFIALPLDRAARAWHIP